MLSERIRRSPRITTAAAMGVVGASVMYVVWESSFARAGAMPWWTTAAGVTHALAGGVIARRLVRGRVHDNLAASLLGAAASAAAVAITAVLFVLWMSAPTMTSSAGWELVRTTAVVTLFSFVTVGWALMFASGATTWLLFRLSNS